MLKKLLKFLILLYCIPFVLVVVYTVIPPVSLPVIGKFFSFQDVHWQWRSYKNLSPMLARTVIAAEDGRFCEHNGVDWRAMRHVLDRIQDGELSHGGSTIAMQTAKNLFLWPLPKFLRKPLEIPLALWIDLVWSKKRLIEVYLNIAQMGKNVYGAEAASRRFFQKPAASLTPYEASLLAAVLPNPEGRNVKRPGRYVAGYASVIRARTRQVVARCIAAGG